MARNSEANRDYGRRPAIHQKVDENIGTTNSYRSMMSTLTLAEVQRAKQEKQSEFEKPYRRGMDYPKMQHLHPDNFDIPYNIPTSPITGGGDGGVVEGDCEQVWENCLKQVCNNPLGCTGAGVVQQMRDCAGDCSKPHEDILSCLHYNSLCFCIECHSHGNIDCGQQYSDDCQEAVCKSGQMCAPFTIAGSDVCPSFLTFESSHGMDVCIKDVDGGQITGDGIYVPCEGCGTKTVTVTDICGNIVKKKVRMAVGAWYLSDSTSCSTGSGCFATGTLYCTDYYNAMRTDYTWIVKCISLSGDPGCSNSCVCLGTPPCADDIYSCSTCAPTCPDKCTSTVGTSIYEWRC